MNSAVPAKAEVLATTPGTAAEQGADKRRPFLLLLSALTGIVLWSFWPPIQSAAERWQSDPQYSHGFLVPPFVLYLLWSTRKTVLEGTVTPSVWGFAGLAAGVAMRTAGTRYFINGLDLMAMLPTLLGAVVLLAGRKGMRWAAVPVGFLVFMIPLPYRLQTMLSGQLQNVGTLISTYVLQTFGLPAISEGNVIVMDHSRIGVVEACSGLGMVVTCAALATAIAVLIKSPAWTKVCLVLAALPISVVTNVVRISATAILHHLDRSHTADTLYHDLAGWFMMPLALVLIGLFYMYVSRLVVPDEAPGVKDVPLPIAGAGFSNA